MGVKRGATVDLTRNGPGWKDAIPGFLSTGIAPRMADGRFAVTADGEIAARDADVWVVATSGLSNPCRFVVADFPGSSSTRRTTPAGLAQSVKLPIVIDGAIDPATDRDDYRFLVEAGSGSRSCFARRAGRERPPRADRLRPRRPRADPRLRGQTEPTLDFRATEAGAVPGPRRGPGLSSHAARASYRLAIVSGPRLVAAFPRS